MSGPGDDGTGPGLGDPAVFTAALDAAARAGDTARCLALLRSGDLALPITPAAAAGDEPAAWATAQAQGVTWVLAYSSVERMQQCTRGEATHARVAPFLELAAGWPDTRFGLAVDAGAEHPFFLESGTVARLAAPTLAEDRAADPDALPAVVQQLLRPADVPVLLAASQARVSGYVHHASDVAHLGAPTALVDAVGRAAEEDELLSDTGSVTVLRWAVVGPELVRTPLGGVDEERRDAVAGWVVEEEPFTGTGWAQPDSLVREYRVQGLLLPHGAELWELHPSGAQQARAVWDGVREVWSLVVTEEQP